MDPYNRQRTPSPMGGYRDTYYTGRYDYDFPGWATGNGGVGLGGQQQQPQQSSSNNAAAPASGGGRGGRRLPQTPKTPSTLPQTLQQVQANGGQARPQFGAIDPRNSSDYQNNNSTLNGSNSQPNLMSRLVPTSFMGKRFVKANSDETPPSRAGVHAQPSHSGQGGGVAVGNHVGRRLPATPNKPSALFSTHTASIAFKNIQNQFTKPSSLPFRQSNTVAVANSSPGMGGGYPSAFSFPKLNGSPSTNASLTNGHPGGNRPTTLGCNGFTPGPLGRGAPDNLSGSGSGSGFMGFGPTGFTTPIDTVLDRFGRTTAGVGACTGGMFQGMGGGQPHSQQGTTITANPSYPAALNGSGGGGAPHRTLPSVAVFGRSNSLGRSLPPIPSAISTSGKKLSAPNGHPGLVRRRTFEDDEDSVNWI